MDSPASVLLSTAVIVVGAIALVTAVFAILERRCAGRIARSPRVERLVEALIASVEPGQGSAALDPVTSALDAPAFDAPALESAGGGISADTVRRIVDPALRPARPSYPWSATRGGALSAHVLGYDGSMVWTRAGSDGLVALFHLGSDIPGLAAEMGVDERVLVEELARRVYGAIDPVVDPTRARVGAPWGRTDREAVGAMARCGARLSATARLLDRDQLDVVTRIIHDGRRPAPVATAR